MNKDYLLERIIISGEVCRGKPRIAGTRIMVQQILDLMDAGKTMQEIISEEYYPTLTPEDVAACIAYRNFSL